MEGERKVVRKGGSEREGERVKERGREERGKKLRRQVGRSVGGKLRAREREGRGRWGAREWKGGGR